MLHFILNITRKIWRKFSSNPLVITLMLAMLSGIFLIMTAASDAFTDFKISKISPQSPSRHKPEEVIAKGKLLVASQSMKDPRFLETVILLIDYGPYGTTGLIINRPTGVKLSTVFPEKEALKQQSDALYYGGPVKIKQIFFLIESAGRPKEFMHVFGDVYASSSQKALQWIIDKGIRFHVYAGYAGWAPQQLEREVMMGGWYIMQADKNIIFDKKPSEIWPELIKRRSGQWVFLHEAIDKQTLAMPSGFFSE